ncbi:MAG: DoxX family protein [Cyclobacteriaceae bacterium]|nr:DoxX family protein [Cyclobacteriaceae bacterium]
MSLLSPPPYPSNRAIGAVRIIFGLLVVYHGHEVFRPDIMATYFDWDIFKTSSGKFLVYAGKASEFIAGVLLTLGLFTRIGALLGIGTFCYITFMVGNGRFWYEDQHPFMFALFGLLFLLTGPGAWSMDRILFRSRS